jgi:creatine kinase
MAEQKELDPLYDLILDEQIAKNEYPAEKIAAAIASGKPCLGAKFCTQEVWDKYKDQVSTGPAKWTIARAINTGIMYPHSFVGCHAGDRESWDDFKDFFYPVIEAYHVGFSMETGAQMEGTPSERMNPAMITVDLSESAQAKIISTRIRIARNFSMFPLNPGGTAESRVAITEMLRTVYDNIDVDELKGDMFLHSTMSDEQRQGLIDDHFLFRGADVMQAASGYHEHWPIGRGVFHNKEKTFVNWINEGDHIRIISMRMGSDVKGVFELLSKGAKAIEDGVRAATGAEEPFMMHPKFGAVTCCPSNLGTGMRGSVHIVVPKLIKAWGFKKIDDLCRERHCQARGSSGEHSEVVDRIGVSNWRRIGLPEYQLVTDMITCVNWLVEQEDALPDEAAAEKVADPLYDLILDEQIAKNEYPAEKIAAAIASGKPCLGAKFCTQEVWDKYKDQVSTGPAKWTIARAINTGIMYPHSFVGCHAGDRESWDDFKDFFYPVIEAYHVGFSMETGAQMEGTPSERMNPAMITVDLSESAQAKIISTRIRIARNFSMFPLNPGGTAESRVAITEMLRTVYDNIDVDELKGDMFLHSTMSDEQRQGLIDDHFLFRGADVMQAASGYHEHWPIGRGVFHNKEKTFVNWINEGDHIRIISMRMGSDVKGVFELLSKGAKAIEDGVRAATGAEEPFMMHPKFGAVTCCPSNLGTGMRGSVHIVVPKLIKAWGFKKIDDLCRERHCQARGSSGEHSEVVDRIGVSNWRRIGLPEYQLVMDMINCVNWLVTEEDALPDEE